MNPLHTQKSKLCGDIFFFFEQFFFIILATLFFMEYLPKITVLKNSPKWQE